MRKFLKIHLLPISIIFTVEILLWHKILQQIPLGEGYYYFDYCQSFFKNPGCSTTLWQYDNLARLLFQILIPFFRDNLSTYMVFQLFIMLLLYITFYFVIFKVSKSKSFGLFSSILFSANFVGSYSMMGTGNYQRFVQRVPNLIPLLISFLYLTKYLENKKIKELIISYTLFAISMFLAHHSTFLLPLFLIYPFAEIIFKKPRIKKFLKTVAISLPYVLLTAAITARDWHKPSMGVFEFLLSTDNLIKKVFYQIPTLLVPNDFMVHLAKHWPGQVILYPYSPIVGYLLIPVLTIVLLSFVRIYKNNIPLTKLYLTCASALPLMAFLNIYAYNSTANPLKDFGEDRTYFIPSLAVAIIWAVWIKLLSPKNKSTAKIIYAIFAILFITYNINLIWKNMDDNQYKPSALNQFIKYSKTISPEFTNDSVIVAPSPLLWPANFINLFYGNQKLIFVSFDEGWEEKIKPYKKDDVFILDYDYKKDPNPGVNFDPKKGEIVDLTEKFRVGEKIEYLKF